tara:strand:- start:39 stop:521 length:483 start_codon:yes stop_codon:yes gene_type:complete
MEQINEKNEEYESSTYSVPPHLHSSLGKKIKGGNITTKITRLNKKEKLTSEEQKTLRWLESKNTSETNKIDARKRIKMDTDTPGDKKGFNNFKDTYEQKKSNPTKPGGIPNFSVKGKGSKVSNQLKNNEVRYYESYNKELKDMKYLIEYMSKNNNNDKTI